MLFIIKSILFRDYKSGYTIFDATDTNSVNYILKGYSKHLIPNTRIKAKGQFVQGKSATKQTFEFTDYTIIYENPYELKLALKDIIGKLESNNNDFISDKHLDKLIDTYGEKVLDLSAEDFNDLLK